MRAALAVTALVLASNSLAAQQPAGADSARAHAQQAAAAMAPMMQQMGPMMAQMAASSLEGTLTTLAKPENAERLADFTKNYYDALIKRGFSKEQALQIVIAIGVPHAGTTQR
jgi:hypothetical protein